MRPHEPHHLLRYLEARPDDAQALQLLGKWYRRRGRDAEAQNAWERSLKADPCDPFTHLYLGNLFYKAGDLDAALERFAYAEMLAPNLSTPLWCQADIYQAQDRPELAGKYYRRALELDPDDEQAARRMDQWWERQAGQADSTG